MLQSAAEFSANHWESKHALIPANDERRTFFGGLFDHTRLQALLHEREKGATELYPIP